MTSRERVLAVFEHEKPDRVPLWFGVSPEFLAKAKQKLGVDEEGFRKRLKDDFRRVGTSYCGPEFPLSKNAASRTVFGIERSGLGYGQPLSHPLENASLKDIHDYPWPQVNWIDVSGVRDAARWYKGEYAILGGEWSPFWHDAIDLVGMENLMIRMLTEPEFVHTLLRYLVDFYVEVNRKILDAAGREIDILFIGNDFGSQTGPLLGPDLFREFILPHLKRLAALGHAYNLKVQLHCCGGFAPLIPMLIRPGIDSLHAVQPSCSGMDLQNLKAQFGSKSVFNGAIHSHHVLINGAPESVTEQTRRNLEIMMPGSGYVAGASHDYILEETPLENVLAMSDTVINLAAIKI